MSLEMVNQLLAQAASLSPEERLLLAKRLLDSAPALPEEGEPTPALKWRDLSGMLPYPAYGEDAQTYISRSRSEDSERREKTVRRD